MKCQRCGGEVSGFSESCPHCGVAIAGPESRWPATRRSQHVGSMMAVGLGVLVVAVMTLVGIAFLAIWFLF